MAAVDIGDENLSEGVARDEADDLLHARGVEAVEDVVEQEYGHLAAQAAQVVKLGELEGDEVGLVLPLRAFTLDGIAAKLHHEVVLVYAVQRIAHDAVFGTPITDGVEQGTAVTM